MKFYRIEESTNLKEVGAFPQRGEMNLGLHKDDPRHLFNQPNLVKLSADVHIPSFKLRKKAKLTDVLSFSLHHDWIISEKLKSIFEFEEIQNVQFVPLQIFKDEVLCQYYLLRSLKYEPDCIDFSKTEISIMQSTWEEESKTMVESASSFMDLLRNTHLPKSIEIKRPFIREDCTLKFFSIRYVYSGFTFFISHSFKDLLLANKITGIRYLELDEVL